MRRRSGSPSTTHTSSRTRESKTFDISTTDEHSDNKGADPTKKDNKYYLESVPAALTGIVSIDPKTGILTYDPPVGGEPPVADYTFTVKFHDGTATIDQTFTMKVTDIPPGDILPPPDGYSKDFYSKNTHTMIEDEPDQLFDIQHQAEDTANYVYVLDGTEPAGLEFETYSETAGVKWSTDGIIEWSPTNKDVTQPNPTPEVPHTFKIYLKDTSPDPTDPTKWTTVTNGEETLKLSVKNVNPVYTTGASATFTEDQPNQTFDVNTTDEPLPNHGPVIYSLSGAPAWLRIDATTGELSMDPAHATVDNADPRPTNFHVGTYNFTILVDDKHGDPAQPDFPVEQAFTLTVANRLDFLNPPYEVVLQEDVDYPAPIFDVKTDDEVDGFAMEYSLSGAPSWLTIGAADGKLSVIPNKDGSSPLDNTDPGTYTFNIVADDHPAAAGGIFTQSFTVKVANRDPDFSEFAPKYADGSDGVYTELHMTEDESAANNTIDFHADDEGEGNTYYVLLDGAGGDVPDWISIDPDTGKLTGEPTNEHTRDKGHGDTPYTFTVRAYDMKEAFKYGLKNPGTPDGNDIDGWTDQVVTLYVDNAPPVFQSSSTPSVQEDTALSFNIKTDDEGQGGTKYSFTGGVLKWDGWITIDPDTGVLTGNPTNANVRDHTFDVRVDDQHGGQEKQTITLTVTNKKPTFLTPPTPQSGPPATHTMTLTEDTTGNFFNIQTDDEEQHNTGNPAPKNKVRYLLLDYEKTPPGLTIDETTGMLSLSPTNSDVGTHTFKITVDDGNPGGVETMNFTLTVVNTTPVFESSATFEWTEDHNTNIPYNVQNTDEPHDRMPGDLDLFTGNSGAANRLYIGGGDGTWADAAAMGAETDATTSIVLGDLDGDRDLDLIVGNNGAQNKVYLSNGDGTFAAATAFGGADNTTSLALGYIDGDKNLDLVVGNDGGQNLVYLGVGDGTFGAATAIGGADATTSLALKDVNNDTYQDLVVGNNGEKNLIYLGKGDGTFGAASDVGTETDPTTSIALGDLDGDDNYDLVVGNDAVENRVYLGKGDGTFGAATVVSADKDATTSIALGDLNGDNKLDLVVGNNGVQSKAHLGAGNGTFAAGTAIGVAGPTTSIALGDVNGDNKLELVAGNDGAENMLYTGDGAGGFDAGTAVGGEKDATTAVVLTGADGVTRYTFDTTDPKVDPANPQVWNDWLYIHPKTGEISQVGGGNPVNHFVGTYNFKVKFFDGTVTIDQNLTLTIKNDPTEIGTPATTDVGDQKFDQDTKMVITDAEVQAKDEYDTATYPDYDEDFYRLYIKPYNKGSTWYRVESAAYKNLNPTGATITYDKITGDIDWTPNNSDVPNEKDAFGEYRHRFRIRHYDGQGTNSSDYFFVYINNKAPVWEIEPTEWDVTEDAFERNPVDKAQYTYFGEDDGAVKDRVKVNEEGLGVTYELQISMDGGATYKTLEDFKGDDYRINGSDGGKIEFDNKTGEIVWKTTNADVRHDDKGNLLAGRDAYTFKIQADDGNPTDNLSTWKEFNVIVRNDPTDITVIPTDGQHIDEDAVYKFDSIGTGAYGDEEVETTGLNTYYELEVAWQKDVGGAWIGWQSYTDYNAGNGVRGDMTFNGKLSDPTPGVGAWDYNGLFEWTPNHDDAEVGEYRFRVTHHDGNESSDTEEFSLIVDNKPPVVNLPPGDTWGLTEDETKAGGGAVTYQFTSDDDSPVKYTEVTYKAQIWMDDGDGIVEETDWVTIPVAGDEYRPNGDKGGVLSYDSATDTVKWETKNADVTLEVDGRTRQRDAYKFRVNGDDGLAGSPSDWKYFDVEVKNVGTIVDPIKDQSIDEDADFSINAYATDEQVDSTLDKTHDSWYELKISRDGGKNWTDWKDDYHPNGPNGGEIYFDTSTGLIEWGNDADHDRGPNNLDVGEYTFRVIHHDGYNAEDHEDFNITVKNTAPSLDPILPDPWKLVEDTDAAASTLPGANVKSEDEGIGVTYTLEISFDGGTSYTELSKFTDNKPNGPDGGAIVFNDKTGEIVWQTTNADVTLELDGKTEVRIPYKFRIQADDGHKVNNLSGWETFDVTVQNDPTNVDPIADKVLTEDDPFMLIKDAEVKAKDEEVESNKLAFDSYYELTVNGITVDPTKGYQPNPATATLGGGGWINFNKDTGEITWKDPVDPTKGPNNRDVGAYKFEVIHYDGHGSDAKEPFTVTILNKAPSLKVPNVVGDIDWKLHEDDVTDPPVNPADWTLDKAEIQSDDEGLGVTYKLWVNDVLVDPVKGYQPNPAGGALKGGGWITYDPSTGEIIWPTENPDVTVDWGAGTPSGAPYKFTIEADDGTGAANSKTKADFYVDVTDDETSITPLGNQTVKEDTSSLNLKDGDVQADDELWGAGTKYTLFVQRKDGVAGPLVEWDDYNAGNGTGADITFDKDTGAIGWTSLSNIDVGTYRFVATHHDGHAHSASTTFEVKVDNLDPLFTTTPDKLVVPALKYFKYDAGSTDERQHDWRGDDSVTYSLLLAPGNMTINPNTGYINWRAQPELAGNHTVRILVDDGNRGQAIQEFTITVDDPLDNLPIEARTYDGLFPDWGKDEGWGLLGLETLSSRGLGVFGGLNGLVPMTNQEGPLVPGGLQLASPEGKAGEEIPAGEDRGLGEVPGALEHHPMKQPIQKKGGSQTPITELAGFGEQVAKGKKLNFKAEEIKLWQDMDLKQPGLDFGGSQSPGTPLEGYGPAVEAGKRLDFDYFEVEETITVDLDDLKASDMLGL